MVGQHIRILKDGRWVHAVDCGDETVLHLAEEAPPPRVRRAYRPEFVAGAQTVEVVTHRERTFPAKEIVKRAYSRASDPTLAAMFRDSEAFVEWCTTGRLLATRNVALEVPGVAPAAQREPAAPAARSNGKATPARRGPKAIANAKAAVEKPAVKGKARPAARATAAVKAKAKPVSKAKAKAKAAPKARATPRRAAAKAAPPSRGGASKRARPSKPAAKRKTRR